MLNLKAVLADEGYESMIKLHSSQTFNAEIERLVTEHKMGYLEAIMVYINKSGLEAETVNRLLSPANKEKLRVESYNLNMFGKRSPKLPLCEDEEELEEDLFE